MIANPRMPDIASELGANCSALPSSRITRGLWISLPDIPSLSRTTNLSHTIKRSGPLCDLWACCFGPAGATRPSETCTPNWIGPQIDSNSQCHSNTAAGFPCANLTSRFDMRPRFYCPAPVLNLSQILPITGPHGIIAELRR
jgi:hypothetical protein